MRPALSPDEALELAESWASIGALGDAAEPCLVVDLRGLSSAFRVDRRDERLATALQDRPWVNVGIVDNELAPSFAPLADAFDVLIGDNTTSTTAIDTNDVDRQVERLRSGVAASPQAAVALVRLLRVSHPLPIAQALHAESLTYAMLQTSDRFQRWLQERGLRNAEQIDGASVVQTRRDGSLLRVTLNRPHRRNALNVAMRDQLVEALELADLDGSIDGVLLTGAGPSFCAGGDLDEFGTTPTPAAGHQVRMLRSLPQLVDRISQRVRVHVHGACVGAGIELPAFASAVIASPDATFTLPEVGFGLIPGAGGTVSVTRRCGRHRCAWLAMTGETIDAAQALRWHLIDRIDNSAAQNGVG